MQSKGNPILAVFDISPADLADTQNWFEVGKVRSKLQEQAAKSVAIASELLALTILRNCPRSADRSASIRKVREAMSTAIEAIMCDPHAFDEIERRRREAI